MSMEGTKCGFDSRCTTLEEMAFCKQSKLLHKTDWDPSTVYFNVSLTEKDNMYTVHFVSQFEDFSYPSIYDIALEHQNSTMKQFLNAVKISPSIIERIDAAVG